VWASVNYLYVINVIIMNLLTLFIIICIVSYISIYTKPKKHMEILQSELATLKTEFLLEKQPLIIYDKIVNPMEIIQSTFKYLYTFKIHKTLTANHIYQSNSRYALIHNPSEEDLTLTLSKKNVKKNHLNLFYTFIGNEFQESENTIQIILKPYNMIAVPYLYMMQCEESLNVYFLNDVFHMVSI